MSPICDTDWTRETLKKNKIISIHSSSSLQDEEGEEDEIGGGGGSLPPIDEWPAVVKASPARSSPRSFSPPPSLPALREAAAEEDEKERPERGGRPWPGAIPREDPKEGGERGKERQPQIPTTTTSFPKTKPSE